MLWRQHEGGGLHSSNLDLGADSGVPGVDTLALEPQGKYADEA